MLRQGPLRAGSNHPDSYSLTPSLLFPMDAIYHLSFAPAPSSVPPSFSSSLTSSFLLPSACSVSCLCCAVYLLLSFFPLLIINLPIFLCSLAINIQHIYMRKQSLSCSCSLFIIIILDFIIPSVKSQLFFIEIYFSSRLGQMVSVI